MGKFEKVNSRTFIYKIIKGFVDEGFCHNLILREFEDETHTPEMRTWESSGILKL